MPSERKPRDVPGMVMAVLFIGLGAWILMQAEGLSPLGSVFPRTIAIALIVFSLLLIGLNLLRPRAAGSMPEAGSPESTPRRLLLVAIMVGWALLLPVIGFFVSSLAAFGVLLIVAEYERWTARRVIVYAVVTVGFIAAFYFLLRNVLLIPVPRGLLF